MRTALRAGILAVAALSIGLGARAEAQGDMIFACVNHGGDVKIVAPNATCRGHGSLISWSRQGPAGPAGPEGPMGPPGPTASVDALQAQVNNVQAVLAGLQGQVDALSSAVGGDDGTAEALVGTWSGPTRSVELVRPVRASGSPPQIQFEPFFSVGDSTVGTTAPQYSFLVPILGFCPESGGYCGNRTISVNPEYLLARGSSDQNPITFTLARDGMKLSGMASQDGVDVAVLRGLVLSNNFFLLRACAMFPGGPSTSPVPCPTTGATTGPVVIYQGVGSLNRDRNRILFAGSAIEAEGDHVIFNLGLTKLP